MLISINNKCKFRFKSPKYPCVVYSQKDKITPEAGEKRLFFVGVYYFDKNSHKNPMFWDLEFGLEFDSTPPNPYRISNSNWRSVEILCRHFINFFKTICQFLIFSPNKNQPLRWSTKVSNGYDIRRYEFFRGKNWHLKRKVASPYPTPPIYQVTVYRALLIKPSKWRRLMPLLRPLLYVCS